MPCARVKLICGVFKWNFARVFFSFSLTMMIVLQNEYNKGCRWKCSHFMTGTHSHFWGEIFNSREILSRVVSLTECRTRDILCWWTINLGWDSVWMWILIISLVSVNIKVNGTKFSSNAGLIKISQSF